MSKQKAQFYAYWLSTYVKWKHAAEVDKTDTKEEFFNLFWDFLIDWVEIFEKAAEVTPGVKLTRGDLVLRREKSAKDLFGEPLESELFYIKQHRGAAEVLRPIDSIESLSEYFDLDYGEVYQLFIAFIEKDYQ